MEAGKTKLASHGLDWVDAMVIAEYAKVAVRDKALLAPLGD